MTLTLLAIAIGLAPLAAAYSLLPPSPERRWPHVQLGEVLLCALAFNLTFLWQELWLVIPKALTPGLHPVLFHNDHRWTGHSPVEELLEGSGAVATLASGLTFAVVLCFAQRTSSTWRLFFFWMTFNGFYQSLSQVAIGTMLPGNDVGRAFAYLQACVLARWGILAASVLAMAIVGTLLARAYPFHGRQRAGPLTRAFVQDMLLTMTPALMVIVPFRLPRNFTEAAVVPAFVYLVGLGGLAAGANVVQRGSGLEFHDSPDITGPALALAGILLLCQCVLRTGIAF